MKRTIIEYKNTIDGKIKITKIDFAATLDEIEKEFGEEILRSYRSRYPYYLGFRDSYGTLYKIEIYTSAFFGGTDYFRTGYVMSKDKFAEKIALLKSAGKNFMDCKNYQTEVKQIII
jgi:hypothetical protein